MESTTGGGGGPAPFLLKTYDMVDDTSTDEIVSWSSSKKSFVVWNPPEFARILLPTYFKHNNFSSFIRQLNTYGFRKIDPERWEFANEEFIKDQKHLLKNIHRRKPTHSHSHPQSSAADPERAAFEEKIEKLLHEKANLELNVSELEQQRSSTAKLLEGMNARFSNIEQRQDSLLSYIEVAIQDPEFVKKLSAKIESMDLSAYSKKRKTPQADDLRPVADNIFRPEFSNVIPDFSDKLRLELSPASDVNLASSSTQSSNQNDELKEAHARTSCLFASEPFDLSDTGVSCALNFDSRESGINLSPIVMCSEGVGDHVSCQLNLTLASSTHQISSTTNVNEYPQQLIQGMGSILQDNLANFHMKEARINNVTVATTEGKGPPARVNDRFWEQFLTERPGYSDNEEASSSYRALPGDDHLEKNSTMKC